MERQIKRGRGTRRSSGGRGRGTEAGHLETPTEAEEDKGSREPRPCFPLVLLSFGDVSGGCFHAISGWHPPPDTWQSEGLWRQAAQDSHASPLTSWLILKDWLNLSEYHRPPPRNGIRRPMPYSSRSETILVKDQRQKRHTKSVMFSLLRAFLHIVNTR